ncbi:MAG TPA: hypothetical protein VMW76_10910 [Bacteroidales bacterium]|nr:hypothetical protein [Bacteroidales bacterium]
MKKILPLLVNSKRKDIIRKAGDNTSKAMVAMATSKICLINA